MIIHYQPIEKNTFRVTLVKENERIHLGTVKRIRPSHIKMICWEATDSNDDHMAVHENRWQAAWALKWSLDGRKGYPPFPVLARHHETMEEIG